MLTKMIQTCSLYSLQLPPCPSHAPATLTGRNAKDWLAALQTRKTTLGKHTCSSMYTMLLYYSIPTMFQTDRWLSSSDTDRCTNQDLHFRKHTPASHPAGGGWGGIDIYSWFYEVEIFYQCITTPQRHTSTFQCLPMLRKICFKNIRSRWDEKQHNRRNLELYLCPNIPSRDISQVKEWSVWK